MNQESVVKILCVFPQTKKLVDHLFTYDKFTGIVVKDGEHKDPHMVMRRFKEEGDEEGQVFTQAKLELVVNQPALLTEILKFIDSKTASKLVSESNRGENIDSFIENEFYESLVEMSKNDKRKTRVSFSRLDATLALHVAPNLGVMELNNLGWLQWSDNEINYRFDPKTYKLAVYNFVTKIMRDLKVTGLARIHSNKALENEREIIGRALMQSDKPLKTDSSIEEETVLITEGDQDEETSVI